MWRTLQSVQGPAVRLFVWVLVLGPAAPAQLPKELEPLRGSVGGTIQCTPSTYSFSEGGTLQDRQPLARALELAAPGCRIELEPGDYPRLGIGFNSREWWSARTSGGTAAEPLLVIGNGARLVPGDSSDTLAFTQQIPCAHIHFENLEIEAGARAGVIFYELAPDGVHEGFHFYDCTIDGKWDHAGHSGPHDSKWGVLGNLLSDFVFAGRSGRAAVRNIRHEHAFYLQNPKGDLTLENIDAERLGRTFVQITAREKQGPAGNGKILVRGNNVRDIGLGEYDNHKGGTAFTFAGRLEACQIVVEDNTYRAGFDPKLLALKPDGGNYGTGALVAWDGGEKQPNGLLLLRNNDFEFASGCGDRPVVSIGGCRQVQIEGNNRFVSGGTWSAIAFDPVNRDGSPQSVPNQSLQLSPGNTLVGGVTSRGQPLSDQDLQGLSIK